MINSFSGRYSFLSNFSPCGVVLDVYTYSSVENAYQAAKSLDKNYRAHIQIKCYQRPAEAKHWGRHVDLRSDWGDIKLSVMEELLRQKFSQQYFKDSLLATQDEELVEGNWWHDNFWGQCSCSKHLDLGENHLGKLLMKIRNELEGVN